MSVDTGQTSTWTCPHCNQQMFAGALHWCPAMRAPDAVPTGPRDPLTEDDVRRIIREELHNWRTGQGKTSTEVPK